MSNPLDAVNKLIAMQTEDIRKERDRLKADLAFMTQVRDNIMESRAEFFNRMERAESALTAASKVLEETYGHGVDNGYWPDIAPVLKQVREALK